MLFGQCDWNGDGVIDSNDDAFELQMLMFLNDEMERDEQARKAAEQEREAAEREERISVMLEEIINSTSACVETDEFRHLARSHGYYLSDFTQEDIDEINRRLEERSGKGDSSYYSLY